MIVNEIPNVEILTLNNTLKSISSPWYTKLPQDSKNQNRNTYLDTGFYSAQKTITTWNVSKIDDTQEYSVLWKYWFDKTAWSITVPIDWTYIISASSFISTSATSWYIFLYSNWVGFNNEYYTNVPWQYADGKWCTLSYTITLHKWDVISFYCRNNSNATAIISISASITKIS